MNLVLTPGSGAMKALKKALKQLHNDAAAALIATASDLIVIVDADDKVADVAFGTEDAKPGGDQDWLGRPFIEIVTEESRPKIEALLEAARSGEAPRWRQVNHPDGDGPDMPVMYAAARADDDGRVVALGRDLRALAQLQRRLFDAQQSLERDYAKLRHTETRYRLLFQMTSEPVVIVNAGTLRIVEANPAAVALLSPGAKKIQGRAFADLFAPSGAATLRGFFSALRGANGVDETTAKLSSKVAQTLPVGADEVHLAAAVFRSERATLALVRLSNATPQTPGALSASAAALLQVVEASPEAVAVTDLEGRLLACNPAFLDLAELTAMAPAVGEPIDRWLGRPGVDMPILLESLREGGSLRLFATVLRGEHGGLAEIEVSAAAAPEGDPPCFGFLIHPVAMRPGDAAAETADSQALPKTVSELTELVGRIPLKDIVRETTDVIERLCIETALDLTGDNRASAAEMLGLSRQSLYVKLRRYGLGEGD